VSRRSLTLLLSGVLAVVLTAGASAATVPYVAYQPGPTFDTLGEVDGTPVIEVAGREVFETEGRLDLTTISLRSKLTLTEAVAAWLREDRAVVPRELVFPPGRPTTRCASATPSA
jgi:PDZ domain-containing protein